MGDHIRPIYVCSIVEWVITSLHILQEVIFLEDPLMVGAIAAGRHDRKWRVIKGGMGSNHITENSAFLLPFEKRKRDVLYINEILLGTIILFFWFKLLFTHRSHLRGVATSNMQRSVDLLRLSCCLLCVCISTYEKMWLVCLNKGGLFQIALCHSIFLSFSKGVAWIKTNFEHVGVEIRLAIVTYFSTTIAFVLLWFIVISLLLPHPRIDLTSCSRGLARKKTRQDIDF